MNLERFSQLWDALVTNRPKPAAAAHIANGMSENTAAALIEYATGDKSKIESVKAFLARPLVSQ
jgi:hypothetical protein